MYFSFIARYAQFYSRRVFRHSTYHKPVFEAADEAALERMLGG